MLRAHEDGRAERVRRVVAVELRPATEPLLAEELHRRETELERLIIKAACRRAARLAGDPAGSLDWVDSRVPRRLEGWA